MSKSDNLTDMDLSKILEALLFVSGEPVSPGALAISLELPLSEIERFLWLERESSQSVQSCGVLDLILLPEDRSWMLRGCNTFEEIFIGSDHKSYKHKYLLAFVENNNMNIKDSLNNYQVTEVSKIEWKTLDKCLESIRPYHLEKKNLIINISKVLKEYRLYS